ncbi:anthranilate synthase component I [Paenibacillus mucilaginosus]|uniref:Anthranilate synthase component 1 n=3 Tax=Paenibacillus mucilaginosus TaxID=61624 RepID=H6NAH6_9BACL|nr:anthranilate synthase component I [Paenibacillus mucilaginosus]AEI41352.1 TrpE [Paenibacillus mucilaginosus KNP414]AFC29901.1 TrpE [Paenibacillus mucilaginosus 3016]AFH62086.1 anthranilate synthase subunit I [Paenibacillus mucilaginosus K02]MCG7211228.1 anthranilate synthase component I [Paenibacillus mucilaginosus]WDM30378.1 anthranilate synthase component I [Paenibacillus mucilaginosus]
MYSPELQEVIRLSKEYNLIPVVRNLMADTETPIRVFQHFYEENMAFLLESVEGGVKWARYSFIGTDPFMMIRSKNGVTTVDGPQGKRTSEEKPVDVLKAYLRGYRSPSLPGLPRFTGGAVGFFGYDLLQYYEKLPAHRHDDLKMNDVQFMFCDQVIVFDHFKQQLKMIGNVHIPPHATDAEIVRAYDETCAKIDATAERLKRPLPALTMSHQAIPDDVELGEVRSNLTKEQFISNVEKAKEYIRAGDIFQVVLSQRFEIETDVSPLQVYRILRTMNPSPYMYCLKMGDEVIVGTSPEALVRVEDEKVQTRPIAGTRPRGRTPEEDLRLEQELLADEKERAEHLMLVDLGRNDIGRVSEFGTVKCDTFMQIERYSHVMHIVSNVSGTLAKDKDFYDAFISCLPAGTVSGAPKLRAMEIIAELEHEARGAYAGAIGYLGFSGNLDTCITIRTIIFKNGKAYVQAGAGIVWDSVPESEYEETVNKAKGMLKSIRMAEQVFASRPTEFAMINQDYYQ